jgi:hypothetical protein
MGSSAEASRNSLRANADSGVTMSFSYTLSLSGSICGLSGTATADVSISGTLSNNGSFSGIATATGGGSGSDTAGDSGTFSFTASGTASGTLSHLLLNATWSGSGSGTDAKGYEVSGSASGGWSGSISLASPSASMAFKSTQSYLGSVKLKGANSPLAFTTSAPSNTVGQPSAKLTGDLLKHYSAIGAQNILV